MSYDPTAAVPPMARIPKSTTARYSSICPVCHIYIACNWSEIVRLPEVLPIHCRDRDRVLPVNIASCNDYTRLGNQRTHRIDESAWVHARCYGIGLKISAAYELTATIPGDDPTYKQVSEQSSKEICILLDSARPLGSTGWGDEEDWAPDHD